MGGIIYSKESYTIIGICMEIHRELGAGFNEAVYKDAIELELKARNIPFFREKRYFIEYKGQVLKHQYIADFVLADKIILEVKSTKSIIDAFISQTLNYVKASNNRLGIVVNFGEASLTYKRVVN